MSRDLWSDNPELQLRYNKILAETRRLQVELNVTPMTLEQRYADLLKRQEEQRKIEEELKKINSIPRAKLSFRRP